MTNVEELKRKKAALITEMRSIVDGAEKRDDKNLTPEEESRCEEIRKQSKALDKQIERAQFLNDEEARSASDSNRNGDRGSGDDEDDDPDSKPQFRNLGEFVMAVRDGRTQGMEQRDLTAGNGPSAGFLIPKEFSDEIMSIAAKPRIARQLSMVIPAGDNPDAEFEMPVLDQTGDKGVYAGVVMKWTAEGADVDEAGDPSLIPVTLKPNELTGKITVTNKMLRNSAAASVMLQGLMMGAKDAAEEDAFFNGDGVGKPLGVLQSKAKIEITRTNSGKVTYEDLVSMYAQFLGENGTWVLNRTVVTDLMTMVATGTNNLVWQPSARDGEPPLLLGLPVRYNEYSPTKGNAGDIALVDMNYYAIKDGAQLAIAMDPYTQMGSGKTRMFLFWNVDGQARISGPMLREDGETKTSPFMVLK